MLVDDRDDLELPLSCAPTRSRCNGVCGADLPRRTFLADTRPRESGTLCTCTCSDPEPTKVGVVEPGA